MSQHMMVLGLNPRTGTKEVSANPLAVPTEGRSRAQISYDTPYQAHSKTKVFLKIYMNNLSYV